LITYWLPATGWDDVFCANKLKLANKPANIPTAIKSLCLRDVVIWFCLYFC
jgi:hypothetical protein